MNWFVKQIQQTISIMSLISNSNKDVMEENSNKNAYIASTQRDLIAGEVSKRPHKTCASAGKKS